MVIVNYKSKRKLKMAIGETLKVSDESTSLPGFHPFFVTNTGKTFRATVELVDGKIVTVR